MFIPAGLRSYSPLVLQDLGDFFIANLKDWSDPVFIKKLLQRPHFQMMNCCHPSFTYGDMNFFFHFLWHYARGGVLVCSLNPTAYYYVDVRDKDVVLIRQIYESMNFRGETVFLNQKRQVVGVGDQLDMHYPGCEGWLPYSRFENGILIPRRESN